MLKKILLHSCIVVLFLNACDDKSKNSGEPTAKEALSSNEDEDLTGTFNAGGTTYSGKVSVQNFEATGQYSVLCHDVSDPNNSKLIQFVFKNEVSARTAGSLTTAYDQGKDQVASEVSVSFETRYRSHEDAKGTVSIAKNGSNNELIFENITLKTMSKEAIVVSGKIPF